MLQSLLLSSNDALKSASRFTSASRCSVRFEASCTWQMATLPKACDFFAHVCHGCPEWRFIASLKHHINPYQSISTYPSLKHLRAQTCVLLFSMLCTALFLLQFCLSFQSIANLITVFKLHVITVNPVQFPPSNKASSHMQHCTVCDGKIGLERPNEKPWKYVEMLSFRTYWI